MYEDIKKDLVASPPVTASPPATASLFDGFDAPPFDGFDAPPATASLFEGFDFETVLDEIKGDMIIDKLSRMTKRGYAVSKDSNKLPGRALNYLLENVGDIHLTTGTGGTLEEFYIAHKAIGEACEGDDDKDAGGWLSTSGLPWSFKKDKVQPPWYPFLATHTISKITKAAMTAFQEQNGLRGTAGANFLRAIARWNEAKLPPKDTPPEKGKKRGGSAVKLPRAKSKKTAEPEGPEEPEEPLPMP